jgi:predicted dehydrogenase
MRSLQTFPEIEVVAAFDINGSRLEQFSRYWGVPAARSIAEILESPGSADLILNLTNPGSHFEVSRACLQAGKHVYSEKPLAIEMDQARELHRLALENGVHLASAPCSVLGKAAQTAWLAIRRNDIGKPLLVYAELDDDFIPQAPYEKWVNESGAAWPYRDEFMVGCTLEHAGYYLTWLMAIFGSVKNVVAASADLVPNKLPGGVDTAPDFSTATLFFERGVVARLTCSIVAPHNHGLKIVGERGVLEIDECWNNEAKVRIRKRHTIRRRLINGLFARQVKINGRTHPMVRRSGAASMNFALGPAEVLAAVRENRPSRLNADFALHLNEVTLAIQNAGNSCGSQIMTTRCPEMLPMPWAKLD